MRYEAPRQFLDAASQPQQGLRRQSETMLAHGGHFYGQEPVRQPRNAAEVVVRRKRELYDVRGRGGKGIGYAYDDCC
jgi:hypothetical protein